MILGQDNPPQQVRQFLEFMHAQPIFFWSQWLLTAIFLAYLLPRYIGGIVNRPKFNKQDIVYQEFFASGNSYRNFITRLGGANRCLRLVVTKELLWVTSWFPCSLVAAFYDLEHVILLKRITSVTTQQTLTGQSLLLAFADGHGKSHRLKLRPKNAKLFVEALQVSTNSLPASNTQWQVGPIEPTLNLREALQRYWYHLIGVAVFPSVAIVGSLYHLMPICVVAPLFFGVMLFAMWPVITKRAPYSFWIVTGGVWLGGGILPGILVSIISHFVKV